MKRNLKRLCALLVVAVLVLAACGGGEAETTTTAGPASTAATEAPATSAPADSGAATTVAPATTMAPGDDTTAGAVVELLISAEDSEGFSVSKLEAPAGQISVTFNNKDAGGEPHNWHVVIEKDVSEYATLIRVGPDTQTVAFTVDTPGEYDYFCDTHLIAMTGTLIVTP